MKRADSLYNKLIAYGQSDYYPYHMPGHKRSGAMRDSASEHLGSCDITKDPLTYARSIDITEIEGFDNLHHPEGIIKEARERAARAYGAKYSYYLVGGSTTGILTAVSALIPQGGHILIARNCHKSVYHAIFLRGLQVSYLQPEYEGQFGVPLPVTVDAVKQSLEAEPDIQAVLITSPTYEGLVADIEGISKVVHEHGIPLIVDEAHGAHFGFADMLPRSSVGYADVVIHSTHKTTRALTQTALLHVCSERVDCEEIQKYLDIYMTSSPSYVLMASIEEAVRDLSEHGQALYEGFAQAIGDFCRNAAKLRHFQVLQLPGVVQDPCKLVIGSRIPGFSGQQLYDVLLEKYHLQMELCQGRHVLAIMTPYDRPEGFERLLCALQELDAQKGISNQELKLFVNQLPEQRVLLGEAWRKGVKCVLEECEGRICSEFVYQYPPGIPIMVPGEVWAKDQIDYIKKLYEMGYEVLGTECSYGLIYADVL